MGVGERIFRGADVLDIFEGTGDAEDGSVMLDRK